MDISVGHTPDSDDAFMFYAMFTDKVKSDDFSVTHVIEDIENLNKKAKNPELDVTAVSVHACAYIPNYVMLRSGGSFGINYGPIVTATKPMTIEEITDVPDDVDIVDVFRPSDQVMPIIKEAIKKKPKVIWLQEGIHNEEAEKLARDAGIDVVYNRCMLAEHRRLS